MNKAALTNARLEISLPGRPGRNWWTSLKSAATALNGPTVAPASVKRGSHEAGAGRPAKGKTRTALVALLAAAGAGFFTVSLTLPLWHLKMEAPQYQGNEALRVHVYPGRITGDLREIRVLNKYIGVHIPEHLPELRWLPVALLAAGGLGLAAAFLPRKLRSRALFSVATGLMLALAVSAGMAQWQMHSIGHDRDRHAALRGVHDFTPPLLGWVKIANFEITTTLGGGAGLIAAGLGLLLAGGIITRQPRFKAAAGAEESKRRQQPDKASVPLAHRLEFSI